MANYPRRPLVFLAVAAVASACGGSQPKSGPVAAPVALASVTGDEESSPSEVREAQAKAEGLTVREFDLNRDGKPDIFKYTRLEGPDEGKLVRKEVDINHDGRIDIIRHYQGDQVSKEETDLDFDGRVDEVAFYVDGVLVRKEIDVNYDGKVDLQKHYVKGKLDHIESDRDLDGRVETWEYFEGGNLDRIGVDLDGDGKVDEWHRQRKAVAEDGQDDSSAPPQPAESPADPS